MNSMKKLPDPTELFEWYLMQFEKWPPLADTIKIVKRAKPGHVIRTLGYLWVQVEEELAVHYAEKNQQGWMQEVQRMPVIQMRNKPKQSPAKEKKKAKLAAAKAAADKKKAEAKPKAEPKKKKKRKDEPAGGAPASPAPPEPLDAKATIAALKSDLNKYKQQAETARAKLESTAGATKPKDKICHHFGKGNHCTYGDKCNYLHCNPNYPDKKPLPNHPKAGAGPDWPPPVKTKKAKGEAKEDPKKKSVKAKAKPEAKPKADSKNKTDKAKIKQKKKKTAAAYVPTYRS